MRVSSGQSALGKLAANRLGAAALVLLPQMALIALAILVAMLPGSVNAHANYIESDPPANSTLETAPDSVVIRFTEPIEPSLSSIRVLDSQGNRVDDADQVVRSTDPHVMGVALQPLQDGAYTVVWKNVSTVDGHLARGSFVFSVGEPLPADARSQAEVGGLLLSGIDPFLRWVMILGAATAFGALLYRLLVAKPVIDSTIPTNGPAAVEEDSIQGRLSKLLFLANMIICAVGVFVAVCATVALIVLQASAVYESSILETLTGPVWRLQTETFWGRMAVARLGLMAAFLWLIYLITDRGDRHSSSKSCAAALACAAGALLTVSLTSHAAATPGIRLEAIANDYVHLVAASVWIGGLAALATGASEMIIFADRSLRRALLVGIVRRFSPIAAASVGLLAMTGLFGAWAQVTTPEAITLPYGLALMGKTALVLVALALAAANLLWIRPRIMGGLWSALWLRRLVRLEYLALALALLAVGYMTAMEPARLMASRLGIGVESDLRFEDTAEGARIELSVEPGSVGPNTVRISLEDALGDPITDATDVRLRLSYLDDDLGETAYSAANVGEGEYALERQTIGISGAWQAEVVVQRASAFDARTAFRFEIGDSGGGLSILPDPDVARNLLGIELGIVGLVLLAVAIPLGGRYSRAGLTAMGTGLAGVVAGVALLFGALGSGDSLPVRNPIPPTQESVAAGYDLYLANCQSCHGERGHGDGPASVGMDPPPADLTVHVPLHPDRALFEFIRDGVPGTSMAAQGDRLTDDEMWHLVNYIQTLK